MSNSIFQDPLRRRWVGWGILAIIFLLVSLHRLSTAVLSENLTRAFHLTATQLGILHAVFFIIYAAVQIPIGILVDRVGPRRVGSCGAVLLSAGAIGFALSSTYLTALTSRGIIGLGSGAIFISIVRFCANWFRPNEFATMTGITGAVSGVGSILATTPLAVTTATIGWRVTVLLLGVIGVVTGGGVYVFVRDSPVDASLDSIDGLTQHSTISLSQTTRYLRNLSMDADQWLLSFIFFATNGTILTIFGLWGVPYLVIVYDLSITTASKYTLLGSVGMLVGGPTIGYIADKIEHRYLPLTAGVGLFTIALSTLAIVGKPPLVVVALVYIISGFVIGSGLLTITVIKERYPRDASGMATSVVNGSAFIGASVLPWIMGKLLDTYRLDTGVDGTTTYSQYGYQIAFGLVSVVLLFAFCCSVAIWIRDHP
ncbi:major facilitator superfamily transport protein (plasmid) [Haloferax gibbonsii]|uniref:Lysosomal dipeptide transporter MFSD1 n=1 Tax=Haloferax gibbonsii TaxID=35746 RepID=A0A871BKB5_HALGI|nr:MFS transporter [Haloferax gibbonsii]QOS13577.1 major facilitator superfamily transport protein [Haloferax gibbonsii]